MTGIRIEDLRKTYGAQGVLCDVSIRMDAPGVYLLAGPNGSGKTTLLELLVGLRAADHGSISVGGLLPSDQRLRETVGFLAQQNSLRKNSTVAEEVTLVKELYALDVDTETYLRRYGLQDTLTQKTKTLSGGMKRRLLIAMLMLPDYDVVILDEPASGLDTSSRNEIWNVLREYSCDKIVLVSDHYLNEAAQYSDYVYLINRGRIVESGRTASLLAAFPLRYVVQARAARSDELQSLVRRIAEQYEVRMSGTVCGVFFNASPDQIHELSRGARSEFVVHQVDFEDMYFFHTGDSFGDEVRRHA